MRCFLAVITLFLLPFGCNYSSVRIPPGMSRAKVRTAIGKALTAEGYKSTAVLSGDRLKAEGAYYVVQTSPHYCMSCGVWNGVWGFPLYWYHHTVFARDDYVRVQNNGYGWCLWAGLVSMLIPVYSSGGLHEAIDRELQAVAAGANPPASQPRTSPARYP
jgi:hypothetical protein